MCHGMCTPTHVCHGVRIHTRAIVCACPHTCAMVCAYLYTCAVVCIYPHIRINNHNFKRIFKNPNRVSEMAHLVKESASKSKQGSSPRTCLVEVVL